MADTMTLDELKESVADICAGCDMQRSLFTNAQLADAINAAIQERDALRAYHEHMEITDQSAIVDGDGNVRYVNVEVYNAMRDRAEKVEAEFASLKAKIEAAPLATFQCTMLGTPHAWIDEKFACPEWIGKHVRLVVEE